MSQGLVEEAKTPRSVLGRLGARLVELINAGDVNEQIEFLQSSISKRGLKRNSLDSYISALNRIREQSKGVTVREPGFEPQGANLLELQLRSNKGGRWARLYIFSDKMEPGRILEFGFVHITDPIIEESDSWSSEDNSEEGTIEVVRRHVRRLAELDEFSGVVLVARENRVLYHEALGLAEKSFGAANRLDTKFNLGSMNKMFTSVAISQLVGAGRLSFDTKLGQVLPDYPNRDAAAKVTIGHLLSHTAGMGMFWESPRYDSRKRYRDHGELLSVFADRPLSFEPGTLSSYSNEGFLVLGAVIEKISGQNYLDYVRDHVFRPFGMDDTDSYALDEAVENLAVGYLRYDDDPFALEPRRPNHMFLGWRGNACGGGYSTALDLLKFSLALRGYKLLDKDLTETITSRNGLMPGYGYGFTHQMMNGHSVRGHSGGGSGSGVNSDMGIFWDTGYTVVVLSNYDAPVAQDLRQRICEFLSTRT